LSLIDKQDVMFSYKKHLQFYRRKLKTRRILRYLMPRKLNYKLNRIRRPLVNRNHFYRRFKLNYPDTKFLGFKPYDYQYPIVERGFVNNFPSLRARKKVKKKGPFLAQSRFVFVFFVMIFLYIEKLFLTLLFYLILIFLIFFLFYILFYIFYK